jgi:hypothetical protein
MTAEIKEANKEIKTTEKSIGNLESQLKKMKAEVKQLSSAILDLSGPTSHCMRKMLREIGIELTIYWSGTFVGPHIGKLADRDRYKLILDELERTLQEMTLTEEEVANAMHILTKTRELWSAFFNLHKLLKVTKQLFETDYEQIESCIKTLSTLFRSYNLLRGEFKKKKILEEVSQKMHLIEAHILPCIKRFGCAWPLSEEGTESAHHWMKLFREQTMRVGGNDQKLQRFGAKWLIQQAPTTRKTYEKILEEGKERVHSKTKSARKKKIATELLVNF